MSISIITVWHKSKKTLDIVGAFKNPIMSLEVLESLDRHYGTIPDVKESDEVEVKFYHYKTYHTHFKADVLDDNEAPLDIDNNSRVCILISSDVYRGVFGMLQNSFLAEDACSQVRTYLAAQGAVSHISYVEIDLDVIRMPFSGYVDANPAETDYASWGTADATSWLGQSVYKYLTGFESTARSRWKDPDFYEFYPRWLPRDMNRLQLRAN